CITPISFLCLFTTPPPTELSTLSLHDALPIFERGPAGQVPRVPSQHVRHRVAAEPGRAVRVEDRDDVLRVLDHHPQPLFLLPERDRKSTRLNSSHLVISYAVFCLKKKKKTQNT